MDEELYQHLGYDGHDPAGHQSGNSCNGTRSKTILTDSCGSIDIDMPRDRAGTFEPYVVKRRQRRLTDVDRVMLSLYARGLITRGSQRPFRLHLRREVSKDTSARSPPSWWRS